MFYKCTESKILIVDDDRQITYLIRSLLTDEGYNVNVVHSGAKALIHKNLKEMDLILLDISMPDMTGYEVCKQIRDSFDTREIPIIFLSGNDSTEGKVKGFNLGAHDYVTKPFDSRELLARIETHLELKKNRDALKEKALLDGLTKLYNHSYIQERLSEEISKSQRHNLNLSLMMFDLDNFKNVNDSYGHPFGDQVLVAVSKEIKRIIREEDIAGRYGGEEFIVILPNTNNKSAYLVAEKIRKSIRDIDWNFKDLSITISGGVQSWTDESVCCLIEKADILLYEAKSRGKDKIVRVLKSLPSKNKQVLVK